ncbi:hypothetical protein EGR_04501 [Echinococcus granulosus]|uniref:Uncharacterized protein n=1 Tax=Echinococcus granulosus TaxID=6210 RepID=W6UHY8_ECHGR|nr:hypothetical protein EGR_04501 [Echinococcus granulosus]EUB60668.1 hypothetical protein EGR_04501 [Echinococcus granulosus]
MTTTSPSPYLLSDFHTALEECDNTDTSSLSRIVFVLTVQCGTMLLREISRRVHLTEAARYEVTGSAIRFGSRARQAKHFFIRLPTKQHNVSFFRPQTSTSLGRKNSVDILTTVIVVPVDCKLPEQNVPLCLIFLLKQYTTRHCPVDKWTADTTLSQQKGVCQVCVRLCAQFAGEEKSPSRMDKFIFTQGEKCAKKKVYEQRETFQQILKAKFWASLKSSIKTQP